MKRTTLLACAALLAVACTKPRTEVIVITDTDLAVTDELDEIRIEVTGPDASIQTATALLRDAPPPRYLGLVHDGGELGPFTVRVRGFRASAPVIERTQIFEFQPEKTLVLRIDLLASCVGMDCGADQTCAEAGCRAQQVEPEELEEFDGQLPDAGVAPMDDAGTPPEEDAGTPPGEDAGPPPEDAGPPPTDAGGCVPTTETCDGTDEDCDDMIDEDFDLMTDPSNCGSCGTDCGGEACVDGSCGGGCPAGTADCDADPSDCETNTNDDRFNCGSCDNRCTGGANMCCSGTCADAC